MLITIGTYALIILVFIWFFGGPIVITVSLLNVVLQAIIRSIMRVGKFVFKQIKIITKNISYLIKQ